MEDTMQFGGGPRRLMLEQSAVRLGRGPGREACGRTVQEGFDFFGRRLESSDTEAQPHPAWALTSLDFASPFRLAIPSTFSSSYFRTFQRGPAQVAYHLVASVGPAFILCLFFNHPFAREL